MKPGINETKFGSITIDNQLYSHDVIINLKGEVIKRKKKLSKAIYGTSHIISIDEAKFVYEDSCKLLIIGTGQYDKVVLSDEAANFLKDNECELLLKSTQEAVRKWNKTEEENVIGLFHLTC